EVYVDHAPPGRGGESFEIHGVEYPSVAHDCIETTEPVDRDTNDRLSPLGTRHGLVRRHRHTAHALDLFDDLVGDPRVRALAVHRASEIVHHHRPTASRNFHRIEAAETSASSSDDHDLASKVDHGRFIPIPCHSPNGRQTEGCRLPSYPSMIMPPS